MAKTYTVLCRHVGQPASSVLTLFKGNRKKGQRVIAVVPGTPLTDPDELAGYFLHAFTIANPNKPHRIRIFGLNATKKVVSSLSQRVV
jgi:hypothetical protein